MLSVVVAILSLIVVGLLTTVILLVMNMSTPVSSPLAAQSSFAAIEDTKTDTPCDPCDSCTTTQTCVHSALTTLYSLSELQTLAARKQVGAYLTGGTAGMAFGSSIRLTTNGSRMIIGASTYSSSTGWVGVYDYNATTFTWDPVGYPITGGATGHQCGYDVAINADGGVIVIGSPNENTTGRVRVYAYNDEALGKWSQIGATIEGTGYTNFGRSVSVSDDGLRIGIGAPGGTTNAVIIYEFTDGWYVLGEAIAGPANSDYGNYSTINADGTIVIIGADAYNSSDGLVDVFQWQEPNWVQLGERFTESGLQYNMGTFHHGISALGTRIAFGLYGYNGYMGAARVYDYVDSAWVQVGSDITYPDDGDGWGGLGLSMSISRDGTRLAIGVEGYNGPAGTDSGALLVYELVDDTWVKVVTIVGEKVTEYSGTPAMISGNGTRVAIGEYHLNQVRTYDVPSYSAVSCFASLIG